MLNEKIHIVKQTTPNSEIQDQTSAHSACNKSTRLQLRHRTNFDTGLDSSNVGTEYPHRKHIHTILINKNNKFSSGKAEHYSLGDAVRSFRSLAT